MALVGIVSWISTSYADCTAGYFSLVTGDYSKAPDKICLTGHAQKIVVKSGALFSINLPANPTTGATWALRSLPQPLMLMSTDFQESPRCKKSGMVGCGGESSFTFKAVEPGEGLVKLVYGRPWQKNNWDSKEIEIDVQ